MRDQSAHPAAAFAEGAPPPCSNVHVDNNQVPPRTERSCVRTGSSLASQDWALRARGCARGVSADSRRRRRQAPGRVATVIMYLRSLSSGGTAFPCILPKATPRRLVRPPELADRPVQYGRT